MILFGFQGAGIETRAVHQPETSLIPREYSFDSLMFGTSQRV